MEEEAGSTRVEPEYGVLLAIDWADQKHVGVLEEVSSGNRRRGEVGARPEEIEGWVICALGRSSRPGGRLRTWTFALLYSCNPRLWELDEILPPPSRSGFRFRRCAGLEDFLVEAEGVGFVAAALGFGG